MYFKELEVFFTNEMKKKNSRFCENTRGFEKLAAQSLS